MAALSHTRAHFPDLDMKSAEDTYQQLSITCSPLWLLDEAAGDPVLRDVTVTIRQYRRVAMYNRLSPVRCKRRDEEGDDNTCNCAKTLL